MRIAEILLGIGLIAAVPSPSPPSQPPLDAPELASLGADAVGTRSERIAVSSVRSVDVRIWYPAMPGGRPIPYRYRFERPTTAPVEIVTPALAVADARPVTGHRYPLVILSHGFRGWAESLSNLGENLASKGYVVAAIEHHDRNFTDLPGFGHSFGEVIVNRSHDQRVVIAELLARAKGKAGLFGTQIDPASGVALMGYSMGGFGALATAGADYDAATKSQLPSAAALATIDPSPSVASEIRALVLFAPWGGAPTNRAWTAASLATLKVPTLVIAGDQDDIADYRHGVRYIYDALTGADRRLLVYREARHNVAGNAPTFGANFAIMENAGEPVWRVERINAINQHFITAFLDLEIKHRTNRASYLDVPTPVASDGQWPIPFGELTGAATAGDGQPGHWRGFQRRWAVGIELHHDRPN